jgi:integrase
MRAWAFLTVRSAYSRHPASVGRFSRFSAAAEKARKRDAGGNAAMAIPALPLHALRHTAASLLLSAGVPAEQRRPRSWGTW